MSPTSPTSPTSQPPQPPRGAALVRAVHDTLNATAVPRTPDPADLPPRGRGGLRLPTPDPPGGDLASILGRRRSSYSFGPQPTLASLATLLHHGIDLAPRAGALPSIRPYLVTRGPGPLPPGVHYADLRLPLPGLTVVRHGDPTAYVAASLDQPPFAERVPLWVALVADVGVALRRYPERHYRTLHIDAGVALESLLLVVTALGLVACPVMGYDDAAWTRLLDLRGSDDPEGPELVTVLVAVGESRSFSRASSVRTGHPASR